MRRFQLGDKLEVRRFVLVATPRALEQQRVTPQQFSVFVNDYLGGLGKPAEFTDLVKYLESQPIGRTSLLGELRKDPTVVSVLQATRLEPLPGYRFYERSKPQYLVYTTSMLIVRGKALQMSMFSLGENTADVEWMRAATKTWADELQRLNR
jgi:hypothetical protein